MKKALATIVTILVLSGTALAYQPVRSKNVTSLGRIHLPISTHRAYVQNGHLMVGLAAADGNLGFHVFRIGEEGLLDKVGTSPCPGNNEGSITGWKHFVFQSLEAPLGINDPTPIGRRCSSESGGIRVIDVSDPANPRIAGFIELLCGSHNVTPIPFKGKLLIYNSTGCSPESELTGSTGQGGILNTALKIEVVLFDPRNPSKSRVRSTPELEGMSGCHDISVYAPRNLAVCVGTGRSALLDISDPFNPSTLHTFETGDLGGGFAQFTWDGRYLLISEIPTRGMPYGEGCFEDKHVTTGVHIWDVEDTTNPVEVGIMLPDHPFPMWEPGETDYRCHASKPMVVPMKDGNRYIAVASFGAAGTSVFDFSDPTAPEEIAYWHPGEANITWWSIWYNGRVYLTENLQAEDAPVTNEPVVTCAVPNDLCEPHPGANIRVLKIDGLGLRETRSFGPDMGTQWQDPAELRP